jgi:hypothetical protein
MFFTPPEKTYSYSTGCKIIAWMPLVAATLLAVSTVMPDWQKLKQPEWMIPWIVSAALSVFLWLFFSLFRVGIHSEGMACSGLFGTREIRWEQVKETRYSQTLDSTGDPFSIIGIAAFVAARLKTDSRATQNLKIISQDGTRIRLNKYLQDHRELMRKALWRVNPRLLNEMRAYVSQGMPAEFGKLQLSQEGVRWGRKGPLPYTHVAMAGIVGPDFCIQAAGKSMHFLSVRASRIPNLFVAVDLIDEFRSGVVKSKTEQLSFVAAI